MRFISFFLMLIFLQAGSHAQLPPKPTAALSSSIQSYMLAGPVAIDSFSGTLLIAKAGSIIFKNSYGLSSRERKLPISEDEKFQLGTFSSKFAQMSIFVLEEAGKLSRQDHICKFVSPCSASWKDITIQQLLENKSGIANFILLPDFEKRMSNRISATDMLNWMQSVPMEFLPGTQFNFSNSNNYILGLIIEKASGLPYEVFLKRFIFEPAGMTSTSFGKPRGSNIAEGYSYIDNKLVHAPPLHPSVFFSAAGVYSTADDLLKWDNGLYSSKLCSKENTKAFLDLQKNAGYGDAITSLSGHNRVRYNEGYYGFSHNVTRFPDDSIIIIMLSNRGSTKEDKYVRDLSALLFGQEVQRSTITEVAVDSSILARYAGTYEFAPGRQLRIFVENGTLHMQATNKPVRDLAAVSDNKFFIKGGEAYLTFTISDAGAIQSLLLHEISSTITAVRKE